VSAPIAADFLLNKDTLYLSQNDTAFFTNNSSGALFYQWNFGDGSPVDTASNPSHFYSSAGTYTVMLVATDSVCADTSQYIIVVLDSLLTALPQNDFSNSVNVVYENGEVKLLFDLSEGQNASIAVWNILGEKFLTMENVYVRKTKVKLDLRNISPGIYMAGIRLGKTFATRKIIWTGNAYK
jgi:PKD repeat protein